MVFDVIARLKKLLAGSNPAPLVAPPKPVWLLELGDEVVAIIEESTYEFPWTHGDIVGSAAKFDRYRVYFTDSETWPESPEFDVIFDEIQSRGGFAIREAASGTRYPGILLNVENDYVWFRY